MTTIDMVINRLALTAEEGSIENPEEVLKEWIREILQYAADNAVMVITEDWGSEEGPTYSDKWNDERLTIEVNKNSITSIINELTRNR